MGHTHPVTTTNAPLDLNGLEFDMVSSTASAVDPTSPTRFVYHQQGELVWGSYTGDTVTEGRVVGQLSGTHLSISFAHELVADRSVVRGDATSRVEEQDGKVALIEEFTKDGVAHESVCLQA